MSGIGGAPGDGGDTGGGGSGEAGIASGDTNVPGVSPISVPAPVPGTIGSAGMSNNPFRGESGVSVEV